MGVFELTTFARQHKQPVIYDQINILDEIRKHRTTHRQSNIIFDMMGFVHNFGRSAIELKLGGRHHNYLRDFEEFLMKLTETGATLTFICDGQLQSNRNDVWCSRRDAEFTDTYKLINSVVAGEKPWRRYGCKSIVKSLLKLVKDKQYGEVVISTQVDCDVAIGKYAARKDALAVVANDSDFLIFKGNFQWWDARSIDMKAMRAKCYDRSKLRQLFDLSEEQMKYLATIAGNDYTHHTSSDKHNDFHAIAQFCRSLNASEEMIHQKIAQYIRDVLKSHAEVDDICKSIASYDINFDEMAPSSRMDDYCSSNVMMYAFFNEKVFQYEASFLDFKERNNNNNNNNNDAPLFMDTLLLVYRRLGGILLKESSGRDVTINIVTKYALDEKYTLKRHAPIFPKVDFDIEDLLFGSGSDYEDIKWQLLLWSIGIEQQLQSKLRNDIPMKYVLTVLALVFLCNHGEITVQQADALLMCQYDILEGVVNSRAITYVDGASVDGELVRVGQLFNRTITLMWNCFRVCGLKEYIPLDSYDAFYFVQLLIKFREQKQYYSSCVQKIRKLRLYFDN